MNCLKMYVFKKIFLFIWLHWVFIAACEIFIAARGIFSCSMRDLVPRPGIQPGPPALGSVES